jgi:hypothetical protein
MKKGFVLNFVKQHQRTVYKIVLASIITLIFLPITIEQIFVHNNNDYGGHILYAEKLQEGFKQIIPTNQSHPLYQVIVLAIHTITRLDFKTSAVILALVVEILFGLELLHLINREFIKKYGKPSYQLAIPLILCLIVAAPIPLMVFFDLHLYFGYLGIANYHNPTINLLKPLAVLNLMYAVKAFQKPKHKTIDIVIAALLIILSTLDKPNITICLMPALAIYAGYNYLSKKRVDWFLLVGGFFIPAILLLGWEYSLAFTPRSGGIQIEPFAAMRLLSDHVVTKLVISILFPAGVAIYYFKEMIKDKRMILTWIIFLFGTFYTYFLIEGGTRRADGNFGWSGEISMVLLFIFSSIFFLKMKLNAPKFKFYDSVLTGILVLYIISGVIYYIYCLNVNNISYLPEGIITPLQIHLPGLF